MSQKPVAYIGIDPGASGAMCLIVPTTKQIGFMDNTAPPKQIMEWFKAAQDVLDVRMILLEKVHAIQGTSAGSNFKFGYNVGVVNALAEASGIGVDHVTPKMWQKKIGVTKKGKQIKKEVAEIIGRLYPGAQIKGPRGGLLDGRSDALCIAHYCYLKYTGK